MDDLGCLLEIPIKLEGERQEGKTKYSIIRWLGGDENKASWESEKGIRRRYLYFLGDKEKREGAMANDTQIAKYWAWWENGKKSEEKFGKKLVSSLKGSRI